MIRGRAFIRKFGKAPNGQPLCAIFMIVADPEVAEMETESISPVTGTRLFNKNISISVYGSEAKNLGDVFVDELGYPDGGQADGRREAMGQTFDSLAMEAIWKV